MAGNWIKMRVDLSEDPAVIAMATALDLDEDTVVGKLHRVWSWFDQQTVDGNAARVTSAWLDRRVSRPGFAQAMISVGWLVATDSGLQLPGFDLHNGETGKARALTAKRVSRHKSKGNATGNATTVTTSNAATVSDALPREEKRREEKKREDSSSESLKNSSSSSSLGAGASDPVKGWEEVEEGLKRLKVSLIRPAIASAKEHGFTVPQVLALIGYLETRPAGCTSAKGAIYNRLVSQAADAVFWDADQNWPWSDKAATPGDAYPVQQAPPIDREAELEKARQKLAEQERLINSHAATLATMTDDELQALISEAPEKVAAGLRKQVTHRGRDSPIVYQTLLELIDARTNPRQGN